MIRLTLADLEMALAQAVELHDIERKKDQLPTAPTLWAVTGPSRENPLGPRIEVEVPRAAVVARLNERRETALLTLKVLGIDFDPAG